MAAASDSGGGSKRRRMDDEGEQGIGDREAATEEDRISGLPEALRLHILGLLPFKSAVRTGALSAQWRALWTHRWPAPSSLDLRLDTLTAAPSILQSLERLSQRRLDRFSLSFQIRNKELKPDGVQRILDYATPCSVADLNVDNDHHAFAFLFKLRLPRGDPYLTRLALGGIRVGLPKPFSARSHTFSALEAISLHGVTLSDYTVENLVVASPLLRTLELCYCEGLQFVSVAAAGAQLRSLTVAECEWVKDVSTMEASTLRSFRYSGYYIRALRIPATSALADLYICFGGSAGHSLDRPGTPLWFCFGWPPEVPRNWLQALTNLSNLTVLTLCSSALRRVSAKARERSLARSDAPCKLQNLRELQLLMFAMYDSSLEDIYVFIVACCPTVLERLFVELPTNSYYYRPDLEPSESEDELLEPVDELPGKELPEEDGPEEELSEEEEELPEGEASEEMESEDDWSDKELSDGGQSEEEPVKGFLENLKLLKMTNFMGGDNEMILVRLVLRNSTSLNQLLLFTSKSDQPEWLQKRHMDTSDILEKILPLEKAWPNAQIILGESDGDAVQPLHRKVYARI
ncbi:hypothetical protein ACQ4PT_028480 [Festuca glaucescens]